MAERFTYRYSAAELEESIAPVAQMSKRVEDVIVVFNNNAEDYALRNAGEFQRMITNVRRPPGSPPPVATDSTPRHGHPSPPTRSMIPRGLTSTGMTRTPRAADRGVTRCGR